MKTISILKSAVASIALASFVLAPMSAFALNGDHDHGKKHGRGNDSKDHNKHRNPTPPKKNGRHDNRDFNKDNRHHGDDNWRGDPNWARNHSLSQQRNQQQIDLNRRQQTKNEWRNLAIGAGLVGALGLLKHDSTLTFAGAAGALYSAYRYEQDRKSQSSMQRARAYYFSQPYFYRDGQKFTKRTVTRNGQRFFQFARN